MSNIAAILLDNLQKIDMSVYEYTKGQDLPATRSPFMTWHHFMKGSKMCRFW